VKIDRKTAMIFVCMQKNCYWFDFKTVNNCGKISIELIGIPENCIEFLDKNLLEDEDLQLDSFEI
jgi:hypothetical protein